MPNIIPPLLSSSPPPMVGDPDDVEDDEFGDFRAAVDLTYGCDAFSLPSTPEHVTTSNLKLFSDPTDINSNKDFDNHMEIIDVSIEKDFQDKRKECVNSEKEEEREKVGECEFKNVDNIIQASDVCEHRVLNGTESPKKCENETTLKFYQNDDCHSQDNSISLESEANFGSKSVIRESESQIDLSCNNFENKDLISSFSKLDSTCTANETTNDETFGDDTDTQLPPQDNIIKYDETNSMNNSHNSNEDIVQKIPNIETSKPEIEDENYEYDSYATNTDSFGNFESIKTTDIEDNLKLHQEGEEKTRETNEDNDFEDFKVAEEENCQSFNKEEIVKSSVQGLESFSDFNQAFNKKEIFPVEVEENSNDEVREGHLPSKEEQLEEEVFNNVDDFGDFEDFKVAPFEITKQAENISNVEAEVDNGENLNKEEILVENSRQSLGFSDLSKSFIEKENFSVKAKDNLNEEINDPHIIPNKQNLRKEVFDDTDDFGDFEDCEFVKADGYKENENNFGAFPTTSAVKPNEIKNDDDDFDDFEDFKSAAATETKENHPNEDFGDFDSFASSSQTPIIANKQDAEKIIKEMFPIIKCESDEWKETDSLSRGDVFEHLKEITETNAIKYVWVQSTSQKMLLRSLNIDTRNILYGPGWNFMVPKFAANLTSSPLEPLKPEIISPSPTSQPKEPNLNDEVPVAQFDWNSSGLVNPLDYSQTMLLDIDELVATLDVPNSSASFPDSEWDNWLDTVNSSDIVDKNLTSISNTEVEAPVKFKSETLTPTLLHKQLSVSQNDTGDSVSLNSLQLDFATDKVDVEVNKPTEALQDLQEFNDFEKFAPNMVPLRETHICNESSVTVTETKSPTDNNIDDDDEFDDFQMVVPETIKNVPFDIKTPPKVEISENIPRPNLLTPLQPVSVPLEPLKPTVVPSTSANIPTKIEWPDPGLNDDDIQNIELSFIAKPVAVETNSEKILPPTETKNNNVISMVKKENSKQSPSKVKKSTPDDDDWTDFVSNTQPAKPQNLQLSVLDLNNLQPVKPPVPVITPHGLMQRNISNNIYIPPLLQTSGTNVRTSQRPLTQPTDNYQPSIISNQFSKEFFGNANPNRQSNNHFITNNCVFNTASPVTFSDMSFGNKSEKKVASNDDDDWTDFISSQPAAAPKANVQQSAGFSFSPNIVNNPGHFNPMSGYSSEVLNRTVKNAPAKKNMVSSISSLPDLDFVISKNRTFSSKK